MSLKFPIKSLISFTLIVNLLLNTDAQSEVLIFQCKNEQPRHVISKVTSEEIGADGKRYELQPDSFDGKDGETILIWELNAGSSLPRRFTCTYSDGIQIALEASADVALRCSSDVRLDDRGRVRYFSSAKCINP